MSNEEKTPLLYTSRRPNYTSAEDNGYLLITTVSKNKDKTCIHKLKVLETYSGTIVTISVIVIVFLLILGVSYHADVSVLTSAYKSRLTSTSNNSFPTTTDQKIVTSQEIDTSLGRLKGYIRQSRKGRDFLAFYKVPYAKPPVGQLRFKDPQPSESWNGVRDFADVAPSCIQKSKHTVDNIASGYEDCLYSNIYVPKLTENKTQGFPVMVYVHGGGYADGNGSRYGANYFIDEEVILITFQYRLGLFGFLNTGDREATGNMGFKDQVMMLRWTKKYIQYFNGNPEKVTIFGNSMGGFSVSYLMISPMANGLFHRAISQSGTVLSESTSNLDLQPEITKTAVAEAFNCTLATSAEFLNCLRNVDARDLALVKAPNIKLALTVEHGFDSSDLSNVFMPDKPYNLLKAGKVNKVPYIMGAVSTEWISIALGLLQNHNLINELSNDLSKFSELLGMNLTSEDGQAIKSFYFSDKVISNETERNFTNLLSDKIMVHGIKVTADFHSLLSDTYLYILCKRPAKSYADKALVNFPNMDTTNVVSHADEIQFLFPYSGYPEYPMTDTEYFPFSEFLVKLWAHFADTGKPNMKATNDWKMIIPNSNSMQGSSFWYELNDNPGMTTALNERMRFWDQFNHTKIMYDL